MTATSELSAQDTQRAYARAAGLFYLLVLAFDIAGLVITSSIDGGGGFAASAGRVGASEVVYRLGLCLSLLGSMSTIPLAIGLYVTLKSVDGNLALTALLFRSAEAVIGAVALLQNPVHPADAVRVGRLRIGPLPGDVVREPGRARTSQPGPGDRIHTDPDR